jgi:hypothetical membrane protein
MSLRRLCLYSGIVSPVLWLGLLATAGALRPDFSHSTNYISELGERGSATEALMRGPAFGLTGFLYLCFAAALLATFTRGWTLTAACLLIALDGVGRMGAGVFPCDPGCVRVSTTQDLHKSFATIGFSSGIVAAILWGVLFRRLAFFQWLSWPSIVSGVAALVSLLLMSWGGDPWGVPGLFEHVATGILSAWLFVFAVYLVWRA